MFEKISSWFSLQCKAMAPKGSLAEWCASERFYWVPVRIFLYLIIILITFFVVKRYLSRFNIKYLKPKWHIGLVKTVKPYDLLVVIVLTLFSLGFRLLYINQPIKGDEAFTAVWYASRPVYVSQSVYTFPNNHLLNTFLIHFAIGIFGMTEFAIRLPALFFAMASIILLYYIVKEHFGIETATITSSLLSASSAVIEYSVNGRGYSSMIFFGLLTWYVLEKALDKKSNQLVFLSGIFASLAIYSIPTTAVAILGIFAYFLIVNKNYFRVLARFICLTILFSLFFYGPVIVVSGIHSLIYSGGDKLSFVATFFSLPLFYLNLLQYFLLGVPAKLFWVAIVLVIGSFVYSLLTRNKKMRVLIFSMLLMTSIFILFLREIPYERIFLYLVPIFYLLISLAIFLVPKKIRLVVSILLSTTILVNGFWTFYKVNDEKYFQFWGNTKSTAKYLKENLPDNYCIYFQTSGLQDALDFYLTPIWMRKHQCISAALMNGNRLVVVENTKRLSSFARDKLVSKEFLVNFKDINIYKAIYE